MRDDPSPVNAGDARLGFPVTACASGRPVFLAQAVILIWRFRRTGGAQVLAMMDLSSDEMSAMG